MELEELDKVVEERFEREFEKAKNHPYLKAKIGDSRKREEIARRIAKKRVDSWLQAEHNMTLEQLKQKLKEPETTLHH